MRRFQFGGTLFLNVCVFDSHQASCFWLVFLSETAILEIRQKETHPVFEIKGLSNDANFENDAVSDNHRINIEIEDKVLPIQTFPVKLVGCPVGYGVEFIG